MSENKVWVPDKKQAAFDFVVGTLAECEHGLAAVLKLEGKGIPSPLPAYSTFMQWIHDDVAAGSPLKLADRYARAREAQQDFIADMLNERALQLVVPNPTHSIDPANFREYKDAVKWNAAKVHPKKYGDRNETTVKTDPAAPPVFTLKIDNS